jgi:pantothenate kinase
MAERRLRRSSGEPDPDHGGTLDFDDLQPEVRRTLPLVVTTLRSIDKVADVVRAAARAGSRTIVGIVGAPGAGKSTIAAQLAQQLPAALLPMDGFHLPQARLVELRRRDRMGAPDTFDVGGFIRILTAIRSDDFGNSGIRILAPGFDRGIEEPVPDAIEISPKFPYLIVEGSYLMLDSEGWERVAPLLDLTFLVDVRGDIRIPRLIARHVEFGKTPEDARAWALGPDQRNAELIEATAARADYLISLS